MATNLPETQKSTGNIAFTDEDRIVLENYLKENNYQLYLFTRYLYFAFIRPKELRNLKVRHIDVTQRAIIIPGEIAKNRKMETVAIIQPLLEIIDLGGYQPDHFLFGAGLKTGLNACSENTPLNWHAEVLKATGLKNKNYTLCSRKHTGAVNAYRSGVCIQSFPDQFHP